MASGPPNQLVNMKFRHLNIRMLQLQNDSDADFKLSDNFIRRIRCEAATELPSERKTQKTGLHANCTRCINVLGINL